MTNKSRLVQLEKKRRPARNPRVFYITDDGKPGLVEVRGVWMTEGEFKAQFPDTSNMTNIHIARGEEEGEWWEDA